MAQSPSHKLGELIGTCLEDMIVEYLRPIVKNKGFYLDYKHPRPARANAREVIGVDNRGNQHKLDIVIEKGGTESRFGIPKAYIEVAWRRYTKHSKNKVQEIEGAIIPLVRTHSADVVFHAAVLAGNFTQTAIQQLESHSFNVLYFDYASICKLYDSIGIQISWEENTDDKVFNRLARKIEKLPLKIKKQFRDNFYSRFAAELSAFSAKLDAALSRHVISVTITPLHGAPKHVHSIKEAVSFIQGYNQSSAQPLIRYEVVIKYDVGDEVSMKSPDKAAAIRFLMHYA